MDEPSVQLNEDIKRAIQYELSTRRPLLHNVGHSARVLQLPRPARAVQHGARVYYNILTNPFFEKEEVFHYWHSNPKRPGIAETLPDLEQQLKDIEILASNLRPQDGKHNGSIEEESDKLDTMVDAVVYNRGQHSNVNALRLLHPNTPVFATQETAHWISAMQHFRIVVPLATFGDNGHNDWKSFSLPPLPEWLSISLLPLVYSLEAPEDEPDDLDLAPAVMIAFNNHHHNRTVGPAEPQPSVKARQKRHATITSIEAEDYAETVFFTEAGLMDSNLKVLSATDSPLYPLAVWRDTDRKYLESTQAVNAKYDILPRSSGKQRPRGWFDRTLQWCFQSRGEREEHRAYAEWTTPRRTESTLQGLQPVDLREGESVMLI